MADIATVLPLAERFLRLLAYLTVARLHLAGGVANQIARLVATQPDVIASAIRV
jgi:hypothetical protein